MLSQLKREHVGALKGTQGVAEADGSSCRFAGNTPETKVKMLLQCFFYSLTEGERQALDVFFYDGNVM